MKMKEYDRSNCCPFCGGNTIVVSTRHGALGINRRRQCERKHRHTTIEVPASVIWVQGEKLMCELETKPIKKPARTPEKKLINKRSAEEVELQHRRSWRHAEYDDDGIRKRVESKDAGGGMDHRGKDPRRRGPSGHSNQAQRG